MCLGALERCLAIVKLGCQVATAPAVTEVVV